MKERHCSRSSWCLKISSWHDSQNSVWNVNALECTSCPAGELPHKTRKPLKSWAEFRQTLGTAHLHISQTHHSRHSGQGIWKHLLCHLCDSSFVVWLIFLWVLLKNFSVVDKVGISWCHEGTSQSDFRVSGCKNLSGWWLWELGGLWNSNLNVSVGLGPVGLELGIKFDVKHAAEKTL